MMGRMKTYHGGDAKETHMRGDDEFYYRSADGMAIPFFGVFAQTNALEQNGDFVRQSSLSFSTHSQIFSQLLFRHHAMT